MKKQESLTIKKQPAPRAAGVSALPAGVLLLTGLWGAAWRWLSPAQSAWRLLWPLLAAWTALTLCLLLRPERRRYRIAALAALLAFLAGALLLRGRLAEAAAGVGNLAKQRLFLQTGRYALPYEGTGEILWLLVPSAAFTGLLCGLCLRGRYGGAALALLTLALLGLQIAGLAEPDWFFAVLLLGVLLSFLRERPKKRALVSAAALLLALALAGTAMLPGLVPQTTDGGLARALHRLTYEKNHNPLPEGDLTAACPAAANEAALEVRMAHWTPLYLRGYVASEYTGTGWRRLPTSALCADAETLYTLQRDYFSPATQLAAAWSTQNAEAGNHVTIVPLGACTEHLYLPYGAASDLPDAADLAGEGSRAAMPQRYAAALYPVEDSYLLQKALSQETGSDYLTGEAAYRQWVYAHDLTVPQSTYEALTQRFSPAQNWTTTQAKTEILRFLAENLTYRESAAVSGADVAAAVLTGSRQGSSVHYATLAVLLLRCCGIPARYVEGYTVTVQQAQALSDGAALTLTERSAHAWAEYYLDGVGWLPFDASPGYTDLIDYVLPDDGTQTENGSAQAPQDDTQTEQTREPNISEEPQAQTGGTVSLRNVLRGLLAALLLVLAGLALRTYLLRRRLRRRRAEYSCKDHRLACASMLATVHDLLRLMQPGDWEFYGAAHEQALAAALDPPETAQKLAALEREVWYSGHAMEAAQRAQTVELLTAVEALWRKRTPRWKRFVQRFIACKAF